MLDQSQRDVLGLGLVALGAFMGFVLYGHWDGGRAGHGLAVALGWCIGEARSLAPVALVVGGGAMLLAQVMPARRPLRTGGLCLFAAVTLALAAGTLGVSDGTPAHGPASEQWRSAFLQAHGGIVGQGLYWAAHRLVQTLGVDILVVFLALVGAVLLTGASLAAALRAAGNGLIDTTRVLRAQAVAFERASRGILDEWAPRTQAESACSDVEQMRPPDPAPQELIVRATHVEAPSQDDLLGSWETDPIDEIEGPPSEPDGEQDTLGGAAGEEITGVAQVDAEALTPQGRLRDVVTDDPSFVWELPMADRILARSNAEQARPDTAGQE
ncbi:MAG TPA: hypothetical protein VFV03_00475, partial [Solirubrobacteraceae bacterium]|nr:hypothetical protein [Solirubrobacteraceae bacterium]